MKNKKIKILFFGGAAVILFFCFFYPKILNLAIEEKLTLSSQAPANPFENINLEAKAALVFDLINQKPIFELNPHSQLPLASLTKIMTAVLAEENLSPEEKSKISLELEEILVRSSNEAASNIAAAVKNFRNDNEDFSDLMNRKAEELGLNQTYFLNETGLDISSNLSGGYSSAYDVFKLVRYALENHSHLFEATTNNLINNSNPYASTTTLLIASKTGLTDLAGGNLAIIFDAGFNHPMAAVVLGSSEEGRFKDIQKLIETTFKYLTNKI